MQFSSVRLTSCLSAVIERSGAQKSLFAFCRRAAGGRPEYYLPDGSDLPPEVALELLGVFSRREIIPWLYGLGFNEDQVVTLLCTIYLRIQ